MILALEATDQGGSVALAREGTLLDLQFEKSEVTHSERLMPTVEALLNKRSIDYTDISNIVVARGPGSFTAIRLAVTTAKTLAMVCDVALYAPTTLRAMAEYGRGTNSLIKSVLDARRGEVYVQNFEINDGEVSPLDEAQLKEPEQLNSSGEIIIFRGRNLEKSDLKPEQEHIYPVSLSQPLASALTNFPGNSSVDPVDTDRVSPLYVRKSDAQRNDN